MYKILLLVSSSLLFTLYGCGSERVQLEKPSNNNQLNQSNTIQNESIVDVVDQPQYVGISQCESLNGTLSTIIECNGSEEQWCMFSQDNQCYADQINNGKCPDNISPRVLCDGEEHGQ